MEGNYEKKPKVNRTERLRNLIEKKTDHLKNVIPRNIEDAEETITLAQTSYEFLKPSDAEKQNLQKYITLFHELEALCDTIFTLPEPTIELRRMLEILIQKDDEWARDEGGDDLRLAVFSTYFDQKTKNHSTPEETLQQIRERRFDTVLLEDVYTICHK